VLSWKARGERFCELGEAVDLKLRTQNSKLKTFLRDRGETCGTG
jgi:hypothetical protein